MPNSEIAPLRNVYMLMIAFSGMTFALLFNVLSGHYVSAVNHHSSPVI